MFGAMLAETGLKHRSRYAVATLMIGANIPDIDAVMELFGEDASLLHRRGMTHGVVALLLLPLLLTGGVWLYHRLRGRDRDGPPLNLGAIVALAYLSTWSHPFLDWMNTYGVRLLMPFDGRWFYGDTLFIVDPWLWLCTAAGVVLARSSSRRSVIGWVVLTTLATLLIVGFPAVSVVAKVLWLVGVAAIVLLRRRGASPQTVARVGFAALVLYLGVAFGLARLAEQAFDSDAPIHVQANPTPANPLSHRVVLEYATHYEIVEDDGASAKGNRLRVEKTPADEVIKAAMAAPAIRGYINWVRFPIWEKTARPDGGWDVVFRDLRYRNPDDESRGIGLARVTLDAELNPVKEVR